MSDHSADDADQSVHIATLTDDRQASAESDDKPSEARSNSATNLDLLTPDVHGHVFRGGSIESRLREIANSIDRIE